MSPEDEPSFGVRLRRLRETAGFTQEELAGRAGLSLNAVSDLERGRRRHPYPHTVRSLADALGLPEDERAALAGSVPRRGGATRVAPSAAPAVVLPEPPSSLVGREREAQNLVAILRRGGTRLLTLTGPGGVGKTRLALEVARNAAGDFPDGAFFVGLAPLGDPDLVVPTISQAAGLREMGEKVSRETLLGYLHKRKLLLVLDNFEHLLGAAPEVASLLGSSPGLVVLATSRAPLRVRGEMEYPVEPLAVPDPSHESDTESVAGSPAAELFARRAQDANPTFALTRKNAAAVAAICWRLDGLPLALELAAARARFLGPTELLARLDRALEAGGARDLPERQRTMRSTLDWSFSLLSPGEQILFRTLSVFAGSFPLEAAESVGEDLGRAYVTDLLGSLVEQSLVAADTDAGGGVRYRMLEPVRQYAQGKLEESGEEERVRGRHAEYYLALAERARPELQGPHQAEWLDALAREHDNVRTAITCLLNLGEPERVARIGWGIYDFWLRRGYTGEGLRWMEQVLVEGGALPALTRSRSLWVISALSFVRGELDRAVAVAAESVAAARAAGDPETLAYALEMQGVAAVSRGDLYTAKAALPEAQRLFRERGDPHGVSSGLYGLANLALARGDDDEAMRLIGEGEAISREVGNWNMLATCLDMQAMSTRLEGDDVRTAELLRESVGIAGMLRDDFNAVYCATGLAGVAARQGRAERAARLFGAADALSEKTGAQVSWSVWRSLNERDLASTHEMLDPEAFAEAWAWGRAMSLEEAVAEALAKDA